MERTFCFFPITKHVDRISIAEVVRSIRKYEKVPRIPEKYEDVSGSPRKYA